MPLLPPLVTAGRLREAGRQPDTPFRIALVDGRELAMLRLLRVLPGKRLVGEAEFGGQRVLAKLFIAPGSERHWQRESCGVEALRAAGLTTPKILVSGALAEGGYALLAEFHADAESLATAWAGAKDFAVGDYVAMGVLSPVLEVLARMHQAGVVQEDLHLGNFLRTADRLLVIDGDSVKNFGRPLTAAEAADNLGMLLAQLPAAWDVARSTLLANYRKAGGISGFDEAQLQAAIDKVRDWRLKDFLGKSVRDCSLFSVERNATRFSSVWRESADWLGPLLHDPDVALEKGVRLKSGNTCTVAKVQVDEREVVIKRYNLKSVGHALSRFWRPSRAWHSWREAHRLGLFGVATPTPLALIEERLGPMRRRAWLVTELCPGVNLLDHLSADQEPPAAEASAIATLFATLHRLKISHGDLKATNLLWHAGRIWLIDLDATTQHRSAAAYRKAWRRDRERLLRNWPENSELGRWLQTKLPPA
ncbi:MAG: hypothetical protein IPL58_08265 [Betaproteobacteria bacterium]|uniref:Protein kinase domain-containing protein n=1 Tax=Candidatus Proximibacter danicus TaxID=2954365 RepID=A0A9D7PRW7_9PROT|nr:hypothetical protein [Candidatus Proximibacter danicus]